MKKTVRVAIYTRQSVSGDKEFGSLEAQREAVEAYVRSQPGWVALPERFDDGGYSGGNTDRPAFQRLLEVVRAGETDCVAVYKLDRLSRSLPDFVRLTEVFRRAGVRFVSTTQAFDTSSSVGRMTVNLLATFADFEREMISERTRDKIAATRRRGLWTGGIPPLGYGVKEKRLVVHPTESEWVREIFRLYLDLRSTQALVREVNRRGYRKRSWKSPEGLPFEKQAILRVLRNPVYTGKITYQGELYEGAHRPIVDDATWKAVQLRLDSQRGGGGERPRAPSTALLSGILCCGTCGGAMAAHWTRKKSRRYTYYVCLRQQKEGAGACPGSRVSAGDIERYVVEKIRSIGRDPELVAETAQAAKAEAERLVPELEAERQRLEKDRRRIEDERATLLSSSAGDDDHSPGHFERLGHIEAERSRIEKRLGEIEGELSVACDGEIDATDLAAALGAFDSIWSELFPDERARVLDLLISRVTYSAATSEVEIRFRLEGVRLLHERDIEKETA